jgi:hypothetical protein
MAVCWDPNLEEWDRVPTPDELPEPLEYGDHRTWHYCTMFRLPEKLRNGVIDVWWEEGMPRIAHVVWLSSNPTFELASVAAEELGLIAGGGLAPFKTPWGGPGDAVRIEVKPSAAPFKWYEYWEWCGVSPVYIGQLGFWDSDGNGSDPDEWFVTPIPIPSSNWLAVEHFDPETASWKPLASSRDRMVRELIPLLPAHLRPGGVCECRDKHMRLSPGVSDSPWCLHNIGLDCHGIRPKGGHMTGDWRHDYEDRITSIEDAIWMWRMADALAQAGVPVLPIDDNGCPLSPWGHYGASTSLESIDRTWLQKHPGVRTGILLGTPSPGIVAVRLSGWHRRNALGIPATWQFHEEDLWGEHVLLLYRSPLGVVLHSGTLARTTHGRIDIIADECWMRGQGRYRDYCIYRIAGPDVIAPLPKWIVQRALRITPSTQFEE